MTLLEFFSKYKGLLEANPGLSTDVINLVQHSTAVGYRQGERTEHDYPRTN
jgi:hypothetical protein